MVTCLFTVATRVGTNRVLRAGRFHHPFGDPNRTPQGEFLWRRQVVDAALRALAAVVDRPTTFDVSEYVMR